MTRQIDSYFNIEGNPTKMPLMPMGARLLNMVRPVESSRTVIPITPQQALQGVPKFSLNPAGFVQGLTGINMENTLDTPTAISFTAAGNPTRPPPIA